MTLAFEQYLPFRSKPNEAVAALFDVSVNEIKQMHDFAVTVEESFKQKGQVATTPDLLAAWNTRIVTPFGPKLAAPGSRLAGQVPESELAEIIAQKTADKIRVLLGK